MADVIALDQDGLDALAATFGPLGARLRVPRQTMSLDAFADAIEASRVIWRLGGLGGFMADPGLAGRMRGAFGVVLGEAASEAALAGAACDFTPQSAFEALFRKHGRMTPGTDFPSPWVIGLDRAGTDLLVHLTVFGMARDWLPAAAEAFTMALRRVEWAGAGDRFVPRWQILSRRVVAVAPPDVAAAHEVTVETLAPLVLSGEGARFRPASVFTTLSLRLEGLARWQEATLSATDWASMGERLRRLDWTWAEIDDVSWPRGSRRQQRGIPMSGVIGRLVASGAPADIAATLPLFRLATLVHAGADIAFGCGRLALLLD